MEIGFMKGENSDKRLQVTLHSIFCHTKALLNVYIVFIEAQRMEKAMYSHEKALEWQELFDLAVLNEMPEENIVAMGYRVAGLSYSPLVLPLYIETLRPV